MIKKGLGELRAYLPRGYGKAFADKYGCSASKIYKVANGEMTDYRILKALKEEAESNYKMTQQITGINKKLKR